MLKYYNKYIDNYDTKIKPFLSCYEDTHGDIYAYIHIHIKK